MSTSRKSIDYTLGVPEVDLSLASCFCFGIGVQKDNKKAQAILQSRNDHWFALMLHAAMKTESGQKLSPIEEKQLNAAFRAATRAELSDSHFWLGWCCYNGIGMEKHLLQGILHQSV